MDIALGLTILNCFAIVFLLHRAVETKEVINRFGAIVNSNFSEVSRYIDELQNYLEIVKDPSVESNIQPMDDPDDFMDKEIKTINRHPTQGIAIDFNKETE